MKRLPDRSPFITAMRIIGAFLPGNFLKTWFYLNLIAKPRRIMRKWTHSFYRIEMVYDVMKEFTTEYEGPFSILELGTANGYSFSKMLYATRYLKVEDKVVCHAFDSFEGLRPPTDKEDAGLVSNDWKEGQYKGNLEILTEYLDKKNHKNYRIHKGYFEDSITPELVESIKETPMLVWVDCDYYKPALFAFKQLLPILPSGCVFYFDDFDFNFGSRFTGEARLVDDVNRGLLGDDIELLKDEALSLDSRRVYRLIRYSDDAPQYKRINVPEWEGKPRPIANGSAMP